MIMKRDDPFVLHLDEIPKAGRSVSAVLEEDWLEPLLGPAWRSAGKGATVSYQAQMEGDNLVIEGTFETDLLFECSRCGVETERNISEEVKAVYLPADKHRHHLGDVEVDDDSLDELMSYEGKIFSVEQPFVDVLALGLSPYPACGPECTGVRVAPEVPAEDSSGEDVDPRWGRLLELKQKLESEQG